MNESSHGLILPNGAGADFHVPGVEAKEPKSMIDTYQAGCRQVRGLTTWVIFCPLCTSVDDEQYKWTAKLDGRGGLAMVQYRTKASALRALSMHAAGDHEPEVFGEIT